MNNITLYVQGKRVEVFFNKFTGGEEHVKIFDDKEYSTSPLDRLMILIQADVRSSSDLIRTLLLKDAVDRFYKNTYTILVIPYMPYARQDRVCNEGEAFSLQVISSLINNANFNSVVVEDPHSSVTGQLIRNLIPSSQDDILKHELGRNPQLNDVYNRSILVSPDEGSKHKIDPHKKEVIYATKKRDPETGQIVDTQIHGKIKKKEYLIIDDICDSGGTFIALAKILKEQGATKVHLYVTHGIFSKGIKHLKENGIDQIHARNVW